jgi:hypothetical protein
MAITAHKIVSILAERSGRTFDIPFQEQLIDMVSYWRSTILKRSLEKGQLRRKHFLQDFVVELEKVPEISCPISYGCVLRSKVRIPKPIYTTNMLFDFVGSADFYMPFKSVEKQDIPILANSEFKTRGLYYTYVDGYLEIYGDSEIKYIGIKSVFENPEDVAEVQCDGDACYDWDKPYPLSEDLIQQIIENILKLELRIIKTEEEVPEVEVTQEFR